MSIIIRDMEMPKDGDVLMVRKDDDGKIYIKGSHTWGYSAEYYNAEDIEAAPAVIPAEERGV